MTACSVSVSSLAGLYRVQARYGKAEPLYRRALEARERALGKDHPNTLQSVNGLATLDEIEGHYGEAKLLHRACKHVYAGASRARTA